MSTATLASPLFVYPTAQTYPFDDVYRQIVHALEARNWSVPGIEVKFSVYGTGAQKIRHVWTIEGANFVLCSGRNQGHLNNRSLNKAAVMQMIIPGHDLTVHDNGSTRYSMYVGSDWESDCFSFLHGLKVNSKLRSEPRTYLHYVSRGNWPLLLHDNDLNREYDPLPGEPDKIVGADLFALVTEWLKSSVLAVINSYPIPKERIDYFAQAATPVPNDIAPIFVFGNREDADRVGRNKLVPEKVEPKDQYGLIVTGYRLVPHGMPSDQSFPEKAYDSFRWAGFGEVDSSVDIVTLSIPDHYRYADREQYVFRVTPRRADELFVADHAAYQRLHGHYQEVMRAEKRNSLTNDEVNEALAARAATLTPLADYDGTFENPVVLISRELDVDEVELVSGPWPLYGAVRAMMAHSPAEVVELTNLQANVYESLDDDAEELLEAAMRHAVTVFAHLPAVQAAAVEYTNRWRVDRHVVGVRFFRHVIETATVMQRQGTLV